MVHIGGLCSTPSSVFPLHPAISPCIQLIGSHTSLMSDGHIQYETPPQEGSQNGPQEGREEGGEREGGSECCVLMCDFIRSTTFAGGD